MDNKIDEKADRQRIRFDHVIETIHNTGKEMANFHKETKMAGLAKFTAMPKYQTFVKIISKSIKNQETLS